MQKNLLSKGYPTGACGSVGETRLPLSLIMYQCFWNWENLSLYQPQSKSSGRFVSWEPAGILHCLSNGNRWSFLLSCWGQSQEPEQCSVKAAQLSEPRAAGRTTSSVWPWTLRLLPVWGQRAGVCVSAASRMHRHTQALLLRQIPQWTYGQKEIR